MENLTEWNGKLNSTLCISIVSGIVFTLLAESKNDEMMDRLKVKLGKTKEDIFRIVSEL